MRKRKEETERKRVKVTKELRESYKGEKKKTKKKQNEKLRNKKVQE